VGGRGKQWKEQDMGGDPESPAGDARSSVVQSALERYQGPLVRYVARILADVDRSADVVQETFLRLWASDHPPAGAALGQWLYTVARNLALDVRRKERRMNPLSDVQLAVTADAGDGPDAQAERDESVQLALEALRGLSENQQEVVRLKFQHHFSYKEIAGITGLSVTNVGFLLHTALKKLRRQMTHDGTAERGLGVQP